MIHKSGVRPRRIEGAAAHLHHAVGAAGGAGLSGQALAGSTTSASQAVSGQEDVLHHQVRQLASAWRAWFRSGSLMAGSRP